MKGIGKGIRGELRNGKNIGFNKTRILSGNHAIEVVRKIVGNTVPLFAELGSIRGDFSVDSPDLFTKERRALQNLVHASETVEEAKREIFLWFEKLKIY